MIKTANLTGSVSRNAGGLFESVRRLVQSLSDTGLDITVFGTRDEHTAADIGLWSPVKVEAFKPVGPHQFGYSAEFRRALFEYSPDLVHSHGIWVFSSIATNQYCRGRGIPYLISAHGMLDPWALRNSRWKKVMAYVFYEGAHLREATCLRALCEPEAQAIRAAGFSNPIAIIPNGIDLPQFLAPGSDLKFQVSGLQPPPTANCQLSSSALRPPVSPPWSAFCPPSSGRKVLLFLSRIHPKKGLVNLLRAWASVQVSALKSHPSASEWTLAIAGWDQGGHEAELKQLATELGLAWQDCRAQSPSPLRLVRGEGQGGVSNLPSILDSPSSLLFLGPQFGEAKTACYANCDGFILPSFSEGVPMVVLEAWVYGKPVLMTPECNLPAGFARGAAIRIETNVDSIAHGLMEFLQASPAQRQALGDRGLQLVKEQFAWPDLAVKMKKLYEWMLGRGPKPDCVV
ncbi:MAG: glycosyltransferase [Verrucomicrobiota bacterium]